jgi:hypothetical protein
VFGEDGPFDKMVALRKIIEMSRRTKLCNGFVVHTCLVLQIASTLI